MKTQNAHAHEDRLLDFAYDELPRSEALLVEQHVQGCSRCSETLRDIRGVRGTMSHLPRMSAPDTGMESLLAYAQQSARRAAVGSEPAPRWWRRLLAPALSVAAVGALGVVVIQVNTQQAAPQPSLKQSTYEAPSRRGAESLPAAAAPAPAAPAPAAPAPTVSAEKGKRHEQFDDRIRQEQRAEPLAKALPSASASAPLFDGRRAALDEEEQQEGLAGSGGGFPSKKSASSFGQVMRKDRARGGAPGAQLAPEALAGASSMDDASPPPAPVATAPVPPRAQDKQELSRESPRDAAVARAPATRSAPAASVAVLLSQANDAERAGDREQEVLLLREAVSAGARSVDVFSRLCHAEAALGRRQNAIEACTRVVRVAPGSSEAERAQRLLEGELRSAGSEAR